MSRLKNILTTNHLSTKRNHLERMLDQKVHCMKISKQYGFEYWDGDRKYGYGGYKYIPGYWSGVAKKIIDLYQLKPGSKILDVGCGKAFLLKDLLLIEPKLQIKGFDISEYAINNSPESIRKDLFVHDARKIFPFNDDEFDLVISFALLHNLRLNELELSIKEIQRVAKKSFVMVESYRNELELFNLQCWALTCESFLTPNEWLWLFEKFNFTGDYEFIYF